MLSLLIYLLVVALLVGLVYYVVDAMSVAEPLNRIIKIVAMVIGVLVVVMALLQVGGYNTGFPVLR